MKTTKFLSFGLAFSLLTVSQSTVAKPKHDEDSGYYSFTQNTPAAPEESAAAQAATTQAVAPAATVAATAAAATATPTSSIVAPATAAQALTPTASVAPPPVVPATPTPSPEEVAKLELKASLDKLDKKRFEIGRLMALASEATMPLSYVKQMTDILISRGATSCSILGYTTLAQRYYLQSCFLNVPLAEAQAANERAWSYTNQFATFNCAQPLLGYYLAEIYKREGRNSQAMEMYKRALKQIPDSQKDFKRIKNTIDTLDKVDPSGAKADAKQNADMQKQMMQRLSYLNPKDRAAINALEKQHLRYASFPASCYVGMAQVAFRQGDIAHSREYYNKAKSLGLTDASILR